MSHYPAYLMDELLFMEDQMFKVLKLYRKIDSIETYEIQKLFRELRIHISDRQYQEKLIDYAKLEPHAPSAREVFVPENADGNLIYRLTDKSEEAATTFVAKAIRFREVIK